MFKGLYFADVYQRSKLVLAEIIALVQTDDIGRLNFVQLPKRLAVGKNDLKLNLCAVGNKRAQRQFEYFIKPFSF